MAAILSHQSLHSFNTTGLSRKQVHVSKFKKKPVKFQYYYLESPTEMRQISTNMPSIKLVICEIITEI